MNDPIFHQVMAATRFTSLPAEYTDRYTPDVAKQQGLRLGMRNEIENLIQVIDETFEKPTKQVLHLKALLEERLELLDES